MDNVQTDEQAVLESIYAEDFSSPSPSTGHVKLRAPQEDSDSKVDDYILIEFVWPKDYPASAPTFTLPVTTESHNINYRLPAEAVQCIIEKLEEECATMAGQAMVFPALDTIKSSFDTLVTASLRSDAPKPVAANASLWEHSTRSGKRNTNPLPAVVPAAATGGSVKKEQLSKAQKRRQLAQLDSNGEKPRGWNWVEIVAHLRSTGGP